MRPRSPVLLPALLAAALPAAALQAPPDPGSPASPPAQNGANARLRVRHVLGEVTARGPGLMSLRPWNPKLPRRVQVSTDAVTRFFELKQGRLRDLRVGEWVLGVGDAPRKEGGQGSGDGEDEEAARGLEVRALLRLEEVAPPGGRPQRLYTEALLAAADPYFIGERRGGVNRPGRRSVEVVARVESLDPLVVTNRRGRWPLQPDRELVVIRCLPWSPESLRVGQTVLTGSEKGPREGRYHAILVARCPEPRLSPSERRRLERREERGGEKM